MIRLTTIASTGRRINRSVKDFIGNGKTSNIEHPTPNIQCSHIGNSLVVGCWMLDVGCSQQFNQLLGGFGDSEGFGVSSLFSCTLAPLCNLKIPAAATLSPAFNPDSMLMKSPCERPVRTNFCSTTRWVAPLSSFDSIKKTESPYGALRIAVAGT